ncbi:DNA topoisomerase 2, partial [Tanacetum coccineum]
MGVLNILFSSVDFNQNEKLKKIDGKKKEKLNIPKLKDANLAATANSGDCILILTQGDSAKALAMSLSSGLSVVGRDCYGVYPLTGKLLNVRETRPDKNTDFQNIMKILGLRHGEIYENVEKSRYGHLMIMADEDHDGSRIKGLLINFLHLFWPSLLKVPNFFRVLITPINIASNKKTRSGNRDFIHLDYRQYLVADLQRSIPSMVDGLKPDQRNILFCAFKLPIIQEINVAPFSDYVTTTQTGFSH